MASFGLKAVKMVAALALPIAVILMKSLLETLFFMNLFSFHVG